MKTIKMSDYNPQMGILISLESRDNYRPYKGSINLRLSQIIDNPSKYLTKDKNYYFYCENGSKSRRAVRILEAYSYKVVNVIK